MARARLWCRVVVGVAAWLLIAAPALAQPVRVGACCVRLAGGSLVCVEVTGADCATLAGVYDGDNTSCAAQNVCRGAPTGACCLPPRQHPGGGGVSGCSPLLNEVQCVNQGGTYQGDGVSCRIVVCPPPPPVTGACCLALGACVQVTQAQCRAQSGAYQGDRSDCSTTHCPGAPTGACCLPQAGGGGAHGPAAGQCGHYTQMVCVQRGGVYHGDNVSCRVVACPPPPPVTGVCCIAGSCTEVDARTCQQQSGVFMGNNTRCATTACPGAPRGACCLPPRPGGGGLNSCMHVAQATCNAQGGLFQGVGTMCPARGCPASTFVGACCVVDPSGAHVCVDTSSAVCGVLGGSYHGLGVACATVSCTSCPCDLDGDGFLTPVDEAIALADFAAQNFDFDQDGDTDQDDLTAFYACFNAGC